VFHVKRSGSTAVAHHGQADEVKSRSDRTIYAAVAAINAVSLRSFEYTIINA
jgi:hypothetical protein